MNGSLAARVAARYVAETTKTAAIGGKALTLKEWEAKLKSAVKAAKKLLDAATTFEALAAARLKAWKKIDDVEEWVRWIQEDGKTPNWDDIWTAWRAQRDDVHAYLETRRAAIRKGLEDEIKQMEDEDRRKSDEEEQRDPGITQYKKELALMRGK